MRCSLNIIKFVSKLFILVLFVVSCEEKSTSVTNNSTESINTLNDSDLGQAEGNFSDYFFDLNSNFSAKFLYYQKESPSGNTILSPTTLKVNLDTLNLRIFSDYVLKVEPEDLGSQTAIEQFDEIGDGCLWIQDPDVSDTSYVDSEGIYDYSYLLYPTTDFCIDIDEDGTISNTNIVTDIPQVDSLTIHSHQFNSLLRLEWDTDDNRYKPIYEDFPDTVDNKPKLTSWLKSDTTLYYNCLYDDGDTLFITSDENLYDSLIYVTPIDSVITDVSGQIYLDDSEYTMRDSIFTSSDIELSSIFEFEVVVLSPDSIMYKIVSDCNQDGVYSGAEIKLADYVTDGDSLDVHIEFVDTNENGEFDCPNEASCDEGYPTGFVDYDNNGEYSFAYEFEDRGNGKFDDAEIYWDKDGSNSRDLNEPFEDLNCNDEWDDAETSYAQFSNQSDCEDAELSLTWDLDTSICFKDRGNGQWDDAELFSDGDPTKLYQLVGSPVNLVVDYTAFCDGSGEPKAEEKITILDNFGQPKTIKLRDCTDYTPLINLTISDSVTGYLPKIDKITTTFSNKVIAQIEDETIQNKDFHILKSEFLHTNAKIRKYNYTILNDDEHIARLKYPSYFKPYGFYFQPSQIEDGFWYEDFLSSEILYYTYDGKIREGEHVVFDSIFVTSHGDYHIESDSFVERPESIVVPIKKVLSDDCKTSDADYPACAANLEITAYDTTLTDCYSVIKTITMTMLGSGVEYGERTTTTFAKGEDGIGLGIVNQKVDVRWSEQAGDGGEIWTDYSNLKLNEFRKIGSDLGRSRGILQDLIGQKKIDIDQLDQLEGDPFLKGRSVGIQSIRLPSNY